MDLPESMESLGEDHPYVVNSRDERQSSNDDKENQHNTAIQSSSNEDTYYLDEVDFDSLCNNDYNLLQVDTGDNKDEEFPQGTVSSFRDIPFESEEMLKFLSYHDQETQPTATIEDLTYKSSRIFPDWITSNVEWRGDLYIYMHRCVDMCSY